MGTMIPFPRLIGDGVFAPQQVADVIGHYRPVPVHPCANGMPGHPPCRSPAELEALLRARADVTAAREGV